MEENYNTMDNTNESTNEMPQQEHMNTPMEEMPKNDGAGAKIGAAIIVVLVVLGGIYFVSQYAMDSDERAEQIDAEQTADLSATVEMNAAIVEELSSVSTSTDIADIEKDLDMTDLGDIDAEIEKIGL